MNFESPLFIIPILTGPIVVIIMLLAKKFPPKKINSLYGYRTRKSMASQEAWDYAQIYSTNIMIKSMLIYTLSSSLVIIIPDMNIVINLFLALTFMLIFIITPIIKTENELKKRFYK